MIRPNSLNIDTDEMLNRTSSFSHQRDKSLDEETSPSVFGNNYEEVKICCVIFIFITMIMCHSSEDFFVALLSFDKIISSLTSQLIRNLSGHVSFHFHLFREGWKQFKICLPSIGNPFRKLSGIFWRNLFVETSTIKSLF